VIDPFGGLSERASRTLDGADYSEENCPRLAHRSQVIDGIVVLAATGAVVAVDRLAPSTTAARPGRSILVPVRSGPPSASPVKFLWGTAKVITNPRAPSDGARPSTSASKAFDAFKVFHETVLDGVNDAPLQALVSFLKRDPRGAELLCEPGRRTNGNLVFRFQYDDHLLHERHAAKLLWNRYVTALNGGRN
jgi:hypothetical protein